MLTNASICAFCDMTLSSDAPGSWYCEGQYPPKLVKILSKTSKQDFAQLEDFNANKNAKDSEHYKKYMKELGN